jgi:hypothetical protein
MERLSGDGGFCNHTQTQEKLFFSRQRDQPQTPEGRAAC